MEVIDEGVLSWKLELHLRECLTVRTRTVPEKELLTTKAYLANVSFCSEHSPMAVVQVTGSPTYREDTDEKQNDCTRTRIATRTIVHCGETGGSGGERRLSFRRSRLISSLWRKN